MESQLEVTVERRVYALEELRTNPELPKAFFLKCIDKGLYFHTDFTISAQHDKELLTKSLGLLREAVRETKKGM